MAIFKSIIKTKSHFFAVPEALVADPEASGSRSAKASKNNYRKTFGENYKTLNNFS